MIHPIFESLPDRSMAEAISQPFTRPGEYKFVSPRESIDKYSDHNFPPVPAHMMSIVAAYLEEMPDGVAVRTRFAALAPMPNMPTSTEIADLYESTIGDLQSHIPNLSRAVAAIPEFETIETLQQWCADTTLQGRKQLIAAHVVGRVASDGSLIDTMAYPTEIMQDLPLIFRNSVVEMRPYVDAVAESEGPDSDLRELQEAMRRILSGGGTISMLGATAVSTFLPSTDRVRAMLRLQLGT